jgi:hypothetical protein
VIGPGEEGTSVVIASKIAMATLVSATSSATLRATFIGGDFRTPTITTVEAMIRPPSRANGEAKKSPRRSGSSLKEMVWVSRRAWMLSTNVSVPANASAMAHHGREKPARKAWSRMKCGTSAADRTSRAAIRPNSHSRRAVGPRPRSGRTSMPPSSMSIPALPSCAGDLC